MRDRRQRVRQPPGAAARRHGRTLRRRDRRQSAARLRTSPATRSWLIAAIVLGIAFRFFHADWKLYSFDETITSLRSSGFTVADFYAATRETGKPVAIGTFDRFQRPGDAATPANVVRSLAAEDPQHPPLYFLTTLVAQRAIPLHSLFWRRLPAIAFGIGAIFAAYWLGRELFQGETPALVLAALVALSPFHATYAQQAREYSLVALLTFASSALVLRSLRTGGPVVAVYALSIALGLWTHPFFGFAALAHGAYVVLPLSGAPLRRRLACLFAIVAGALSFLPWISVLLHSGSTTTTDTGWFRSGLTPLLYAGKWFFNFGSVFFDLDYVSVLLAPIAAVLLAAAAAFVWLTIRRATRPVWSFVALLGGVPASVLLAYDLAFHFTYGVQARYLTPVWIALELAAAFGLTRLLQGDRTARLGGIATGAFLVLGAASLAVSSYASSWWLASRDREIPAIAEVIRRMPDATIVAVDDDAYLLELLPLVPGNVSVILHDRFGAAAFRSAAHPLAIVRASELEPSFAPLAESVPLPQIFPPAHDPMISRLRRAAAAHRRGAVTDDPALFTR